MRRLFLLLLVITTLPVTAETIHRRVLPDGSIEFSDEPRPGSIPMEVPDLQTFESQPLPPLTPPPGRAPPPPVSTYQSLRITQPTEEQTLFFDAAGVGVSVAIAPALRPGDRVVVYLDGQPVATGPSTSLTIPTPPRGTHRLSAEVQDASGRVVLRSPPVTFHLIQHSQLLR
ncbi:MAG: hypothetical protein WDA11_07215 [Thiohalomonadaceae bacterium]